MAYNMRRTGGNFANSVNSVGQRRPPPGITNNFVPGGQMTRQAVAAQQNKGQQNKSFQPQQQQQTPQQQQQQNKTVPQQQQLQQKQVAPQQQIKPSVQQQQPPPQPQVQPPAKQVVPPPPQPQGKPVQQASPSQQQQQKPMPPSQQLGTLLKSAEQLVAQQQQTQNVKNESDESQSKTITESEVSPMKPKPFWVKRGTGRISKAEKMRKRNLRLRKMLQPKNALMVLNELVGNTAYTVQEVRSVGLEDIFKATVAVDGIEHIGAGKSKVGAKTTAAEAAIKHIVLKKICAFNQSALSGALTEDGQTEEFINENIEKMDEGNAASEEQEQVSWSHIASFAIHKLFSSWDEDGNITDLLSRSSSPGVIGFDSLNKRSGSSMSSFQVLEQKPAKKIPENAVLMNPIMLLNQMHPNAKYEEIAKTGNPPHIQFTIKCIVLDQEFVGVGRNKKTARKQAAFAACTQVLGIHYPPEILDDGALAQPQLQAPMDTL